MRRAIAIAALVALSSACARTTAVHVLAQDQLPRDLYGQSARTTSRPRTVRVTIYLVRLEDRRLQPVVRTVTTKLDAPEVAIRALLVGPTKAEYDRGLRTAIPLQSASDRAGTELLGISERGKVATVNLSGQFEAVAQDWVSLLRIAQVVWTLTELDEVDAVRFRIHWVDTPVVDQDGVPHDAVSRARYSRYAPPGKEASVGDCTLVEGC